MHDMEIDPVDLLETAMQNLNSVRSQLAHSFSLCENLSTYRKEGKYCDIKLKVGKKVFECHRLVLDCASKYFQTLGKYNNAEDVEPNTITLPIEYVDEESFSKLLDAIYSGCLEINKDDLVPLFNSSLYLQLTHFIDRCKKFISDNLEVIDVVELIMLPQLKFDKTLYEFVKMHLRRNFSKIHHRMAGISLEILEDLLSDPELFVSEKEHLLEFGRNWIAFDLENRKQHLPTVASLLKPFYTFPERLLKLVSAMQNDLQSNYDVRVALNILLESPLDTQTSKRETSVLPDPLFFIQPNDDSGILLGTLDNDDSWEFWNEIQLPDAKARLKTYEGTVANNMFYFSANCDQTENKMRSNILFQGFKFETREWVQLFPPRNLPQYLVACNSMMYSYENSVEDYQISSFEPSLNRWLKVPAVNYPRNGAGIAIREHVLYMVGGVPQKKIDGRSPTNIIEMYDTRCKHWSRIRMNEDKMIENAVYNRRVCFLNDALFIFDEKDGLKGVDIRNRSWLPDIEEMEDGQSGVDYLIAVDEQLWVIYENSADGIAILDADGSKEESISNPNAAIRPIPL